MTNEKWEECEKGWQELMDFFKAFAEKHAHLVKKEIVIDKLGKWKMRNGEFATITTLNSCNDYPVEGYADGSKSKQGWRINGAWSIFGNGLKNDPFDLVEFISPSEFTEEGLYETDAGEKIEIDNSDLRHGFLKEVSAQRFWCSKSGIAIHPFSDALWHSTNLVRYLGKKPFEIDKPGVYETYDGKKVHIYYQNVTGKWNGTVFFEGRLVLREFNSNGDWYSDVSGFIKGGSHSIKKFISSTYDFSKQGE